MPSLVGIEQPVGGAIEKDPDRMKVTTNVLLLVRLQLRRLMALHGLDNSRSGAPVEILQLLFHDFSPERRPVIAPSTPQRVLPIGIRGLHISRYVRQWPAQWWRWALTLGAVTGQPLDGRTARLDGYARLYGPLAVVSAALIFLPLLEDVVIVDSSGGTLTWDYGTLWEMAGNSGGEPAALGILLAVALIVMLTVATFRTAGSWPLPTGIAVVAALVALMLLTKPGVGDPPPDLTPAGTAALVVAIYACVLGVAHGVHAGVTNGR
jgi:hypothetical protein